MNKTQPTGSKPAARNTKDNRVAVHLINDECTCPVCGTEWWLFPTDEGIKCDCGTSLIVATRKLQ